MKLTVQKELEVGAVLQQQFIVEYLVNHQMCSDCHRIEAKDYWRAIVQVSFIQVYILCILLNDEFLK